jgi:FtsP/CotA-like multicopper oxidase with cupredoxin domain
MSTDEQPSSRMAQGAWLALGTIVLFVAAAVLVFAATGPDRSTAVRLVAPSGQAQQPAPGGAVRDFTLTATPATLALGPGLTATVWGYDGTVPGPELRVQTGDLVRVRLQNRLPVPTTIHWHGVPVANGQDGVAGVTQDAVAPGGSATYAFVAPQPGTYWYHSHQDPANQVGLGLYGALVVEPRTPASGVLDQTLIYGEWALGQAQPMAPPGDGADMVRYGVYSVNGRTGSAIQPVRFQPGQTVRLRLVNAGNLTHYIHPPCELSHRRHRRQRGDRRPWDRSRDPAGCGRAGGDRVHRARRAGLDHAPRPLPTGQGHQPRRAARRHGRATPGA